MRMLSLVTLVVVLLAGFFLWRDANPSGAAEVGRAWLPELSEAVNDVASLTISSGGESFDVQRGESGWTLDAWGGYPATFATVKAAITGLSDLTVRAPMTTRKEKHAALGLDDPGEGNAAIGVRLSDEDGRLLADVIVGQTRPGTPPALYVRRAGEDATWLVDGKLDVPGEIARWADKELLRIPTERVQSVVIEHPDGETVTVERPAPIVADADDGAGTDADTEADADADVSGGDDAPDMTAASDVADASTEQPEWVLRELPLGEALRSEYVLSSLAGALARLDLEAVAQDDDVPADAPWTDVTYTTKDGLTLALHVAQADGKTFARLDATRAEDATSDADEFATITARAAGRTFVLPSWRATSLLKHVSDLVEPPPSEDEPESAGFDLPRGAPFAPSAEDVSAAGLDLEALQEMLSGMNGASEDDLGIDEVLPPEVGSSGDEDATQPDSGEAEAPQPAGDASGGG